MKKAFTLLELLFVIVIIGILYSVVNFSLSDTSLRQAANQLISHINYAKHLALQENKMQYYPLNSSEKEIYRSKYWFKQWWQIRIGRKENNEIFYEIFSDSPDDFNRQGEPNEIAQNPLQSNLRLDGNQDDLDNYSAMLNLSAYYHIVDVLLNGRSVTSTNSIKFLFDNYGNVYLREGELGDGGDINPYDVDARQPLTRIATLTLCKDANCEQNISICLSPKIGFAYICE